MKKVLCWLCMITCLTFGCASAETAGTSLGFGVLRALSDGTKNQLISPISLAYALALAAEGAEGATAQELLDALGVDGAAEVAGLNDALREAGLKIANAVYVNDQIQVEDDFITALREQFDAERFTMSENAAAEINGWIKAHTDGLIENFNVDALNPDTMLVLVNAIAMDAKWAHPFKAEDTYDQTFHAPDGDVEVPFLHGEFSMDYAELNGTQMIRLNYVDSGLSMLIALPEAGALTQTLDALCEQGLHYFQFSEYGKVKLSMPKLDITAENGLAEALKQLGVNAAFSAKDADFSKMCKDTDLMIGDVLQKVRVLVDEDGTKAAAATEALILATSAMRPDDPVEVTLDRPFVLVIADEASGAVCFAGVIANPAES